MSVDADTFNEITGMPIRYGWTFRTVPLTGRECWIQWPDDGSVTGPFPALCLLIQIPQGQADAEAKSTYVQRQDVDKRDRLEWLSSNALLDQDIEQATQFMRVHVVLAGPPTWEDGIFELFETGSREPKVWWTPPPAKEDQTKDMEETQ